LYAIFMSLTRTTCPAHLITFNLIPLILWSWSSSK
jgi:hypothetical protein